MKLNINFMIKDGKKIISRDTRGYKVLLNRVIKSFEKINAGCSQRTIDVIIQTGLTAAKNKRTIYSRIMGQCFIETGKIVVWAHNCNNDMNEILETLAHEFGHFHHWYYNINDYRKCGTIKQEIYADKYAKKMVKRELITVSKTGLTKYSRKG